MKYLLPFSVLLFFVASFWAVKRVGKRTDLSISLHVAKTRGTMWIFGGITGFAAILAAISFFTLLLPRYDANTLSYILFGVIVLDFLMIAAVPHIEGTWRSTVHNAAAWGMVYVIPVLMLVSLTWPLNAVVRLLAAILLVIELVLLALATFRRDKYRPVFLYFQVSYLSVFFLFLLLAAYA